MTVVKAILSNILIVVMRSGETPKIVEVKMNYVVTGYVIQSGTAYTLANTRDSNSSDLGKNMNKKDKTQLQRHIFIDQKIREGMRTGQYANCTKMALEYEVSTKTLMRDIDYLKNQCETPLEYDAGKKGYYYTEANYKMPAVHINASDLFAICLAEKVLEQHRDTPIYDKLVSVFDRIEESLPETIEIHPAWVTNRISIIQPHRTAITTDIWGSIAEALQRGRRISITYQKPTREKAKKRDVDPYHLVNFQGEWYLIAFCHKRQKILTFAVSRIKTLEVLTVAFVIPVDFDFEATTASFGIFSGSETYQVKILFSKKQAPYILERQWHPSQKFTKEKDGSLLAEITTSHLLEIKQWVMSFGSGAEVLEPSRLRKEIKKELNAAVSFYKD